MAERKKYPVTAATKPLPVWAVKLRQENAGLRMLLRQTTSFVPPDLKARIEAELGD